MEKSCKDTAPQLYWGFPVEQQREHIDGQQGGQQRSSTPQRGISLLIAVMVIVVVMSLMSEMIVSSSVQVELAAGTRDRIRSEYLAKSGFNLAALLLSISHTVDLVRAGGNLPPPIKQEPVDGHESLWNVINKLPLFGARTVELIKAASGKSGEEENNPFKLGRVMTENITNQMALFEDSFSVRVEDEGAKINVNDIVLRDEQVIHQLKRLFSTPVEKAFLEKKELSAEELTYRILDFVSPRGQTSSQSNLNESFYQDQAVPYKIKKQPFDTVGELKLVAGWDDDIHAVFSPYLTVYPYNKPKVDNASTINLNTASRELKNALIPESNKGDCAEKFAQHAYTTSKKAKNIANSQKDIDKYLREQACFQKNSDDSEEKNLKVDKWFGTRSKVFRFKVNAETGNQQRVLEAVVQKFDPKESDEVRKSLKEKRALRILYWRFQ